MHLRAYVVLKDALLIQVYSVSNQTMVQEDVIKLLIQLHIHKLKVIHVVRYLEDLILRIKQHVRLRHVILVSVIQQRVKSRIRPGHRVSGPPEVVAVCTTTQNPPPQVPVPPATPVSVYLHRNVHESTEMNQTLQSVFVVLHYVLLLVLFALKLPVHALLYQIATLEITFLPTKHRVQNVVLEDGPTKQALPLIINVLAIIAPMEKQLLPVPRLHLPASSTHVQTPTHYPPTALPEAVQHPSRTILLVIQAATPATKDRVNVVATPASSLIPSPVPHVPMENTNHKTPKPIHLVNSARLEQHLQQLLPNVPNVDPDKQ